MTSDLQKLIDKARNVTMTSVERETQRRSFAFGNTHIENDRITREHIDRAADKISTSRD
ncbi:hypothetical protein ENSA7_63910 [Enhygromyxa salina]|uniref:Uncharacterized protein n=1 Tax=Enhygromyxa salina TaxID=215803 RepID=A0A2S9Y2N2_9BACT|nr:hypothetical protein ENSA7_63910 [Enhygromyxa salina]